MQEEKTIYIPRIVNKTRSRKARAILRLRARRRTYKDARRVSGEMQALLLSSALSSGEVGMTENIRWVEVVCRKWRYRNPKNGQQYIWR